MKRHPSLIPISRQHHGGLLTARLLQHGAPPYKGMPTTPEAKRGYVIDYLNQHLLPHFKLEEETVFILAADFSEGLKQQVDAFVAAHQQLQQLILALPGFAPELLPDKLDEIGKLLEQHIRQEERVFFEQVQKDLPPDQLQFLEHLVLKHLA
ncbi:hemerythrin domain-containing protein [Pontibacter oryzae]|uniref:Hemerythrin-like domain-containing protein n=1 Tax=Pontibacter oryzae TaxID=2304593 RepID=A0A399SHW7_9BACT|nr:hemerythrin domain-containing protein [Pontibacter oryzae]RIJ43110.1 hypothetical protein D1627_04590 [Pontibacter oryzae]